LLSIENKVHESEVTSNFVREQRAFLKSQVRDRSSVTAVQNADCKSEICSNARAALFFILSPYWFNKSSAESNQRLACSQACFLSLLRSQAIPAFRHFSLLSMTFSQK